MNDIQPIALPGVDPRRPLVIAGPCSAETEEQVIETARLLAAEGFRIYRAGLWKPRTKPGGFEGVGAAGIPWLQRVRRETGMYVSTEVATREHVAAALAGGIDLLLTHSPAAGLNDGNDRAHKGFACFNDLLEEYQPKWFVHGHVHLSYNANLPRVCTHGQTTVINATERYTFEIPDPDPVARKRFFWNDPAFPTKN